MNKAEFKVQVLRSLLKELSDKWEGVEKEAFRKEGGAAALFQCSKNLEGFLHLVEKDEKEGGLTPEEYKVAKKWVLRCVESTRNLALNTQTATIKERGRAEGLVDALKKIEADIERERSKLEALQKAVEEGEVVVEEGGGVSYEGDMKKRPKGARPVPEVKKRKRRKSKKDASNTL